jgi:suppressor for copper-sensitivity B
MTNRTPLRILDPLGRAATLLGAAIAGWLAIAAPAVAAPAVDRAASPWSETPHGAVRLVSTVEAVGRTKTISLGLQFRMAAGWKIYWRSPGDAGYPPRPDWRGSANLARAELLWPAPERFSVLGFETLGYEREVVLPVRATLDRPGAPLALRAAVDYLTCADICVPYSADLALDLPAGPALPSPHAGRVGDFLSRVPATDGGPFTLERAEMVGSGDATGLRVVARGERPFVAPDLFVEGPPELGFGAPQVAFADGGRRAVLELAVFGAEAVEQPLIGSELIFTLVDGDRAVERRLRVDHAGAPSPAEPASATAFVRVLLIAVLGGLILNLMPCVLPVLSIKLLSVVAHGGAGAAAVRAGFLASAAGIVFSFLVLALAAVLLKATGTAVGWGIQFQQPWFLVSMVLIVTLFACNLWGLFDVPLPRSVADAGARIGRAPGLGGQFLTGVLATLLATPCSAPFVGTALGFALARGPVEVFSMFAALGVGLALPYLLIAARPVLANRLPRPGPWMITLKRILALALGATGVWLLTVLAGVQGRPAAAVAAVAALLVVLGLAVRRRLPMGRRRLATLALAAVCIIAFVPVGGSGARTEPARRGPWMALDPARISALVADGRVVFVNVTADWCITCRVNEELVLGRPPVSSRLTAEGVTAMRGDWTRPDPAIAEFLARFGRYGIPFDAVYGPGTPDGEALPELLTADAVLAALERAAARPL